MNIHLIMTVGTGTAGRHSNLAQGLVNTLKALQPIRYWLVPSAFPDSLAIADLIRETYPSGFEAWSPDAACCVIAKPDDLFDCRATLRRVIARARVALDSGGQLVVNPTSGTKQMSVGATLAALDEEIGVIAFTVGERADGVVKTGTEKVAPFDTGTFFVERDIRTADMLFQAGAFSAAARLMERWRQRPEGRRAREMALTMDAWQRQDYGAAAGHAATWSEPLGGVLGTLARAVEQGPSKRVLADLLVGADALRRWREAEAAAGRYYKAVEYALRLRLAKHMAYPFSYADMCALGLPAGIEKRLFRNADGSCTPGLRLMQRILDALGDPLPDAIRKARLGGLLEARNRQVHEIRPIHEDEAHSFCDRVRNALLDEFPGLEAMTAELAALRPRGLPGASET